MKPTDITRERFEAEVPAFRSPTDEIWQMVEPLITSLWSWIEAYQHTTDSQPSKTLTTRAACCHTAAHAISQLDLVLTPNGFGIVNNQNVSPASRERTEALRKELADRAFWAREELVYKLEENRASSKLSLFSRPLFFPSAIVAKRYGLSLTDGTPITSQDDWERTARRLFKADDVMRRYLSRDYIATFLISDNTASGCYEAEHYEDLTPPLRRASRCLYFERLHDFKRAFAAFLDVCERLAARPWNNTAYLTALTRYLESSEVKAFRFARRGNQKGDTAFFFG